jgi:hypothetical protein
VRYAIAIVLLLVFCFPPAPVPEVCPGFAPDACDLCVSNDEAPIESCALPCACEVTP